MAGMSCAQGHVFRGAQLSFQHLIATENGLKAHEKQPLGVISGYSTQNVTLSAVGCPRLLSSSRTGAPAACPR